MSKEKKPREKDDKESIPIDDKLCKDMIYRRSQTSDIKLLLKVYNNNKFQWSSLQMYSLFKCIK